MIKALRRFSLNAALSPLFTPRYTSMALDRLPRDRDGEGTLARKVVAPTLGIFRPRGTGVVRVGGISARQHDGVTCAATGILMLNAAANPVLGAWLDRGVVPAPDSLPVEISSLTTAELAAADPLERLRLAEIAVHDLATRRTLGPFGWPKKYGTPPWGAARVARVPGVKYSHRPVNDRDGALMDDVLGLLVRATSAGIPVPIYSGGDLSFGWDTAMPRHLILALPTTAESGKLRIYEPGSGRIHTIAPRELRRRSRPHPALGGWTHLAWTLIPIVP